MPSWRKGGGIERACRDAPLQRLSPRSARPERGGKPGRARPPVDHPLLGSRRRDEAGGDTIFRRARVARAKRPLQLWRRRAGSLLHLPRFWRAAFSQLDRLRPDLVHCHDFDTLPAGLLWGALRRRPVIYDAHEYYADLVKPRLHGWGGGLLYRLIQLAERWGAARADAIVTVDATLAALYQRTNRRVIILGHYPNRALAEVAAPTEAAASVFSRADLTLLYVGRLSEDRGLLAYVGILRRLREQGVPARLRLVGAFTPPEEEDRLRAAMRGLESAVEIVGWVPYAEMPAILRGADVGLSLLQPLPRYVAALPVKLFEYMAAGLPVVASDFPAVAAIVHEARCGALLAPADEESAAAQIRRWWEHPDEARALGENGRQAILRTYNWESVIEQLAALYDSLGSR